MYYKMSTSLPTAYRANCCKLHATYGVLYTKRVKFEKPHIGEFVHSHEPALRYAV